MKLGSDRRRTFLARFAVISAAVLVATLVQAGGGSPALAQPGDPTQPNEVLGPTSPPELVDRIDTRRPSEIFVQGFVARGDDINIVRHVQGNGDSAYVSTTTDRGMFDDFAGMLFEEGTTELWVYRIRATSNFYNAAATLRELTTLADIPQENRDLVEELHRDYEHQREWSALGGIPPSQILEARRLPREAFEHASVNATFDSLLEPPVLNQGGYVFDSTRGNYNLITNEAYTGIRGPGLDGACSPPARSVSANGNCPLGGFAAPPAEDRFDGKPFTIRPKAEPWRALEVGQDKNQTAFLNAAHEFGTQELIPESTPNAGRYRLKNSQNGHYLTAATSTVYGDAAQTNATVWSFERQPDGWFRIVAHDETFRDQLTMNKPGSVQMTSSDTIWGDWNLWSLMPIGGTLDSNRPYHIEPIDDRSKVVQVPGSPSGGANVSVAEFSLDLTTRWFPTYDAGKGAYKFRNGATDNYNLAWESSWGTDKTNVTIWDGSYDDQHWILRENVAGFLEFVNYQVQTSGSAANYKVLTADLLFDLTDRVQAAAGNVTVADYYGDQNQQWIIRQFLR